MTPLLSMGQMLSVNAALYPTKTGTCDTRRSMTFPAWNARSCRLAHGFAELGLEKGDRVAVLAYNCVEWMELYAATAKAGLVCVPINFRLLPDDILYIVEHSGAAAIVVQDALIGQVDAIRDRLPAATATRLVALHAAPRAGWHDYEAVLASGAVSEPDVAVAPHEPWMLMYTSGTTGRPKGAIRSHGSQALLAFASLLDMGFDRTDTCLLVMPLCHANSLNMASTFAYAGATCVVDDARSFDPERLLRTMSTTRTTFTSLVPTHYVAMLDLPDATRARYDVDCVRKLLVSSAPARHETKVAIMVAFPNSRLLELYGSTEQGWATLLRPDEQLTKAGTVGREFTGSGRIKLLDDDGLEVPEGEVGELYSRTPWCFEGYWEQPDKTATAFRGDWLSVGDMARRDADGFYRLVDRRINMIISGGENVYPSEVEQVLARHPKIRDVAVVGRPHDRWGEAVHAVVVLRDGEYADGAELIAWCDGRLAGYKRPKSIAFIADAEMPRTATGKILHRVLKQRQP